MKNHHFTAMQAAVKGIFLFVTMMIGIQNLHAQPGATDSTFDPGTGANEFIRAIAVQKDGKILIGGFFSSYNGTPSPAFARLNSNGTLDATFNTGTGPGYGVFSIIPLSNGKILIAGNFGSYNGIPRRSIARINSDGSLDPSFNPGLGVNGIILSMAVQTDGKILIGGDFTTFSKISRSGVARLNSDGTLDPSFDPGAGANDQVRTLVLQPNGKIVVAGTFTSFNNTSKNRIVRLNNDGSIDATFNPGTGTNNYIFALALQTDGKILIGGGFTTYNAISRNLFARLNSDGSLDQTFKSLTGLRQDYGFVNAIAVQSKGKIVIAGSFESIMGGTAWNVTRINSDASLDQSFYGGSGANNMVYAVTLQTDGKILIGGSFTSYFITDRIRIARIIGDETLLPLTLNANVTTAHCGRDGGLTVLPQDGTSPYQYSIDGVHFQTANQFTGLTPGTYTVTVKDANNLSASELFIVGDSCLSAVPTVTSSTCGFANGRIELSASGGTAPYQYSLDGVQFTNSNLFNNLTAKDYTAYIRDATGSVVSTSLTLSNIAGPVLSSVDLTGTNCINNTGSATIVGQGGTPPFQYVLNAVTFQSSPVFSSLGTGSYKFTIQDANGCFDSRTATITVKSDLILNAGADLIMCEGSSIQIAARSNATSFSWSPATALTNTAALTPVCSATTTTTYIVTASLGQCTAKDTVAVKVNPVPVANAGKDLVICPEQQASLSGSGGITYDWSPSRYLSNASAANPVMSGAPVGRYVYSLQVTDDKGCRSLQPATVMITVVSPVVDAGRDTVILAGEPLRMQAVDPSGYSFFSFTWSPTTGLNDPSLRNPVAIIDRDQTYTVTAKTPAGCTATDNIQVKVYKGIDIYVPTAFSPNNDGKNDVLKAFPVGIREFRSFCVYNRWGVRVFQTTAPAKGWDGKVNGVPQEGVYVWTAEGVDYSGKSIKRKGTTLVIR